jgi:hypothetical protein
MNSERTSENAASDGPIFVLGMAQRSGTNFLADLICLHPDCGLPAPIWEDYLLHHAGSLLEYADSLHRIWYRWIGEQGGRDLIHRWLGDGLLSMLSAHTTRRRLVTKTPSVRNLRWFFHLFPEAYLLVLIRDGRAVVESQRLMAGGSFDTLCSQWADAAEEILRFDATAGGSGLRYRIVRYEDLVSDLWGELDRLLAFLRLDPEAYDFVAAEHLPVRGSSAYGRGSGDVHWAPVERSGEFAPLRRWAHWTPTEHRRFNWIAGRQLERLGYHQAAPGSDHAFWRVWNVTKDIPLAVARLVDRARARVRRRRRGEDVRRWTLADRADVSRGRG